MPRLIEWERLELTLRGEKIAAMIGEAIEAKKVPITCLFLEFRDGELAIEGKAKKGLTIPFEAKVRSIRPDGGWLRVRIDEASAFGLPVPAFLQKFIEGGVKDGSVRYDPETTAPWRKRAWVDADVAGTSESGHRGRSAELAARWAAASRPVQRARRDPDRRQASPAGPDDR